MYCGHRALVIIFINVGDTVYTNHCPLLVLRLDVLLVNLLKPVQLKTFLL